jgi:hypothetical protein
MVTALMMTKTKMKITETLPILGNDQQVRSAHTRTHECLPQAYMGCACSFVN